MAQGNETLDETALLRAASDKLREVLPPTWTTRIETSDPRFRGRVDAFLVVQPPTNAPALFVVEVRRSTERRSIRDAVEQLEALTTRGRGLIVTDYANPALRELCQARGLGYVDLTGWVYLRVDNAGLFISRQGDARAPSASGKQSNAMIRLDGPAASRLVRTLWFTPLPVGVRELAEAAAVSPGTAAKALPTLSMYGAVQRDPHGSVVSVDRRLLVDRWVQDYGVYTTNPEVRWHLDPRGPEHALKELRKVCPPLGNFDAGVSITGYQGATANLPQTPAKIYLSVPYSLLAAYSGDPSDLAKRMRLHEAAPTTANVVLIRPRDLGLLNKNLAEVSVPQVIADLLTMGGRFPELAEQLLQLLVSASPRT